MAAVRSRAGHLSLRGNKDSYLGVVTRAAADMGETSWAVSTASIA
jgi:hypothetical protein